MVSTRLIRTALAIVVIAAATAAGASTQLWNKRTQFTFSGPVAVPGVTLPAGSYDFRLVETTSRNVIQVLSANGDTSYAMFFGLPALRNDIPEGPELRFMETAEGVPAAIESWWYPGTRRGYEFIYPKDQARLLAYGVRQPVLTTMDETTEPVDTGGGEFTLITPEDEELAYEPAPAAPVMEPEPQAVETPAQALPKTAGPLPLAGFGGLALLLGAAVVRVWRVHIG
jgi:hypothetical protein